MFRFQRERVIGHFLLKVSAIQRLSILTAGLVGLALGAKEPGEKSSVDFGAENDFVYQYLWRGISYNRGLLAQPSVWLSRGNFSLTTWCNLTLWDFDGAVKQHEVDLAAQYDLFTENFSISPVVNLYFYPNETRAPATGELSLNVGYCRKNWEFSASQYVDYIEYQGAYYGEAGMTYAINALTIGLNLGWASTKFNQAYNCLSHGTLSNLALSCSYEIGLSGMVIVRPHFEYFYNIDYDLRRINGANLLNIGLIFSIGA